MRFLFTLGSFAGALALTVSPLWAQEKEIVGWVERVGIREAGFSMQAKLDTGADASSIHATKIEEFRKKKSKWVRFQIRNNHGEVATLERPVERMALIKRHSGKSQRRFVVQLGLCLGGVFQEEDVNLVDRGKFDYRFLLGRSFLVGNAIVDPAVMFSRAPDCVRMKETKGKRSPKK